jgi:phage shock protein PspC (stress-responsive transcriptional regulator)
MSWQTVILVLGIVWAIVVIVFLLAWYAMKTEEKRDG